jgi:TadE-like protein
VAEFAMVGGLLTLLFVALLQLALAVYTRNVLIDCAAEGARYGALAQQESSAGADRTRALIRHDLADRFAREVSAQVVRQGGLQVVEVRVRAPLPVLGVLGLGRELQVSGHAIVEGPGRV